MPAREWAAGDGGLFFEAMVATSLKNFLRLRLVKGPGIAPGLGDESKSIY
jgi:hypothetical protein